MDMETQYKYDSIWFELTRRCNLRCPHCSCGPPQDLNITTEIIDRVFSGVKDCRHIALIGGEPLLCLDMAEYIVDKIGQCQWTTQIIELTTNGTIEDARIIKLLSRFCESRPGNHAVLRVSTDEFHDLVTSAKGLTYYWELCQNLPNITILPADRLAGIHLQGRANKLIEARPELAKTYSINAYQGCRNHRMKIADNKVRCAVCVYANGNVGLAEQVSYDAADISAFGNILSEGLTELVDGHNNKCLITCDELTEYISGEMWLHKYIEAQFNLCDVIPDRIKQRFVKKVLDLTVSLRQKAQKLYRYVPAQDIIDIIPVAFVKENMAATIPMLSPFQIEKRIESKVLEEINEFSRLSTWTNKESLRIGLLGIAYMTQELEKLPPDLAWADQPLQKLSALNEQYRLLQRPWKNDKNYPCDDDKALE